jgi:hypothetical protein
VRVPDDLGRVDEEEELSAHVVRVVERERVFLHEAALVSEARELEGAGVEVTPLLRPDSLEVHRTDLAFGLKAEVAGRDPLGEEARAGQVERHVPDLEPPQQVVLATLVEDVDAVRGVELAGLVEVDVDVNAVGDGPVDLGAEE